MRELVRRISAPVARLGREITPGVEPVAIERLICPLRYDIQVRIDFIELLRERWDEYEADLERLLQMPEARAYAIWFREVACARFHPQAYADDERFRPLFRERVHATARLWKSIERNGYDPSTPIRLESGRTVLPVNGKRTAARLFAGDGCHRMACLYVTGRRRLEPDEYVVAVHRQFEPLDNTAILIGALPLDRAAYASFLSRFYGDGAAVSPEELTRAARPDLLPELESVLAFDLPKVG